LNVSGSSDNGIRLLARDRSAGSRLLTQFVNALIEVIIEIMTRFLRIESRVDSGHGENRSGIVERIPNCGVVGVPGYC
jgi:hypothetical protein